MKSVTQRIKEIKQPVGGYLNPKYFEIVRLNDDNKLFENENIVASLVGLAVDYLTRYMSSNNLEESFKISLMGAEKINELDKATKLLDNIKGLDDASIINACKLCGYDVCYRAGTIYFKNIDDINPDKNTIYNIKVMVQRSLSFFENYGPIVQDGITFEGGYTSIISAGDADFVTEDTLWDFKVSKNFLTKEHTLQLLIYYLLGVHSYKCDFSKIKKLGVFNPRKNEIYFYEIKNISSDIIKEIEDKIIGYSVDNDEQLLTVNDIMKLLGVSRTKVMHFYHDYNLPLMKDKNKYVIKKVDFDIWLEEMKKNQEEQEIQQFTLAIIIILLLLFFAVWLYFFG